ncbi:hypothetical protein B4135_1955 [Caldibacillus debilis]|jgi:hypothetical protein|uniref:Uncharacterized protein n=1 Tax=Caldibacillus debilis TaxID=301148 RepID=A0A150M7U5_9BACI|nr:hypothetical protein B4135_1955 [Caldibacillus debilis]
MAEFYPAYSGSFYADGKAVRAVEDFRKDFVRNRSTVFSCFRFCEPAIIKGGMVFPSVVPTEDSMERRFQR